MDDRRIEQLVRRFYAEVLGIAATGALVTYSGAAFFSARDGRLLQVWVLGDVDGLRRQLGAAAAR